MKPIDVANCVVADWKLSEVGKLNVFLYEEYKMEIPLNPV